MQLPLLQAQQYSSKRVAGGDHSGHAVHGLQDMHKQTMQGKFMLQLDEVVNIAAGIKDRCAP
jgi:hypothetical protein